MNKITVAGILGKDSEIRYTQSSDPVLDFSIADSQVKEKPTIWWNCQLWGKRAEYLKEYLKKGQPVTVCGSVIMNEYTNKAGEKKQGLKIRVDDIALQGKKPEQQSADKQNPAHVIDKTGFDDMEDDIPF